MKYKYIIVISAIAFTGCSKHNADQNQSSQTQEPSASMVKCGEEQFTSENAEYWECIDDSHFLCLKDDGCKKGDLLYPKWSVFGDNSNSFDSMIPKLPVKFKGYQLEANLYGDEDYSWRCTNRDCDCGLGQVHGYSAHERCVDETYEAMIHRDCGEEKCMIQGTGTCREGKCYCGETWQGKDSSGYTCGKLDEYFSLDDESCKQYPELCQKYKDYVNKTFYTCTSEKGCACGEHKCIQNSICMKDKCFCGDTEISDFKDLDKYICQPDNVIINDMICNDGNGCLCGEHKIVKGAVCRDNKQYCHNVLYDWLDEKQVSQYICDEFHPMIICENENGCQCGSTICVEGAACMNNQCVCGDNADIDPKLRPHILQYICKDGKYTCKLGNGCQCGEDLCIQGVTCNADGCLCSNKVARYEKYPDFICDYDLDYHPEGVFRCEKEDGCKFDTSPDNPKEDEITSDEIARADDVDNNSVDDSKTDVDNPEEEKTDYIKACDEGDSCDAEGECYYRENYNYTYYTKTLYYNHQRIGIEGEEHKSCTDCDEFSYETEDVVGSCAYLHTAFTCKKYGGCHYQNKLFKYDDIWDKDYDPEFNDVLCQSEEGCDCGSKRCNKGSYCHNGQCLCNNQPIEPGFICENNKPVCNSPNCKCGGEPLRENFKCFNDKQLCRDKSGCLCGNTYIAYNNICDHNIDICALGGLSYHSGCKCGEQILTDAYYCNENQQMVCNKKNCACGESTCHKGDFCQDGKCLCGATNNNGCLCGTDILKNNEQYVCMDDNLVCRPDIVHDGDHYPPNPKTCSCGDKQIAFGAICKHDQECTDCPHKHIAIIDADGYYNKTCDKDGKSINLSYQYVAACYYTKNTDSDDYHSMYYKCDDENIYYEHTDMEPCDCLNEGAPDTEEGLNSQYCLITEYYEYDCSDHIPNEVVDGWYLKGLSDDPTYGMNYCTDARNNQVPFDANTMVCQCGKHKMNLDEVKNKSYVCDNLIAWRCIKDEGCDCGDAKCGKLQYCLKPGQCSK